MLDERDYISRLVNTFLESLNRILFNINSIELYSKKEIESIEEIENFFKKNLHVDLNNFVSIENFIENNNNHEYTEVLIKFYYIQHLSKKNDYKNICLNIIHLYKKKYMIFNFHINEIEIYFSKNDL